MALANLAIFVVVDGEQPPMSDARISFVVLTLLFALAEWRVIHVQLRSEASSFSLSEIPLVLGLLLQSPEIVLVATLLGSSLTLLARRRQPPIKLMFNLCNLGLYAGVAGLVLSVLPHGGVDRWIWLAALVSIVVGSATNLGLILVAVSLTEGFPGLTKTFELLSFALSISLANASVALVATIILSYDIAGLLLLVVPAILVFSAFRRIATEREHRERIEFLYRSTQRLDVGQSEAGLENMLAESRTMFRAGIAAVILESEDGGFRVIVNDPSEQTTELWTSKEQRETAAAAIADVDQPALVSTNDQAVAPELVSLIGGVGGRDAMVARLATEQRSLGLLVVANRLGDITSFSSDDLKVLDALAKQSAVLLHSDSLETALQELRALERKLAYQANHDSLTGLPNRSHFTSLLQQAVDAVEPATLFFIDLDRFKPVNDEFGHAAGDAVLIEMATRLRGAVRTDDTVARLGGDEFVVLVSGTGEQTQLADRIVSEVAKPVAVAGTEVHLSCSIGVARVQPSQSADELLRDADAAMYQAKKAGDGVSVATHDQPA